MVDSDISWQEYDRRNGVQDSGDPCACPPPVTGIRAERRASQLGQQVQETHRTGPTRPVQALPGTPLARSMRISSTPQHLTPGLALHRLALRADMAVARSAGVLNPPRICPCSVIRSELDHHSQNRSTI